MDIWITRLTGDAHRVRIRRADATTDQIELGSRSYLRHDLAHFAVEVEVPIRAGFWGLVAGGAALADVGLQSDEIMLAESLAGPVQTLMRIEAAADAYCDAIARAAPHLVDAEAIAVRIHGRVRQLRGHLRATPFREPMHIVWPESFE